MGGLPPIVLDDVGSVEEGQSRQFDILANDSDPDGWIDASTVSVVQEPALARAWFVLPSGAILYQAGEEPGVDVIVYKVCDNTLMCGSATLTVTVFDD